ncbi:MAG: type II toxin-antitoxin system RelE/ParE family toxin [Flavobacteriales bacterium]|nr:type II toxin-antitoxin system RelE/ParE family toxin [Flavobacteriales bacterium]
MAKEIVWTKRASAKFDAIIDYLETDWNEKVVRAFVQKTEAILQLLARTPELGTLEHPENGIRGFKLTKHNRLFYRVEKNRLVVLNLFDNRQHTKKKRY